MLWAWFIVAIWLRVTVALALPEASSAQVSDLDSWIFCVSLLTRGQSAAVGGSRQWLIFRAEERRCHELIRHLPIALQLPI